MSSAWAQENQRVLGQLTTEAKSNEITAIPELLELLDLHGAVVTIDAMGGQKTIAEKVVAQGGDYILQVKDNHPTLRADLELLFAEGMRSDCLGVQHEFTQDVTAGHGRVETRRLWATDEVAWYGEAAQWKGLARFICIEAIREVGDKRSTERRYYLSSLRTTPAKSLLRIIRGHWGVENGLHWCLDVSFNEDNSRIRKGPAAVSLEPAQEGQDLQSGPEDQGQGLLLGSPVPAQHPNPVATCNCPGPAGRLIVHSLGDDCVRFHL
jgi:predicted transposase YbfD/YdcC